MFVASRKSCILCDVAVAACLLQNLPVDYMLNTFILALYFTFFLYSSINIRASIP